MNAVFNYRIFFISQFPFIILSVAIILLYTTYPPGELISKRGYAFISHFSLAFPTISTILILYKLSRPKEMYFHAEKSLITFGKKHVSLSKVSQVYILSSGFTGSYSVEFIRYQEVLFRIPEWYSSKDGVEFLKYLKDYCTKNNIKLII